MSESNEPSQSAQHQDKIRRAARAKAILEDPLVIEALAQLESECLARWRHSPEEDRDGRERLYQSLRLIDKLRQDFTSLVLSGRMSEAQISRQNPL